MKLFAITCNGFKLIFLLLFYFEDDRQQYKQIFKVYIFLLTKTKQQISEFQLDHNHKIFDRSFILIIEKLHSKLSVKLVQNNSFLRKKNCIQMIVSYTIVPVFKFMPVVTLRKTDYIFFFLFFRRFFTLIHINF